MLGKAAAPPTRVFQVQPCLLFGPTAGRGRPSGAGRMPALLFPSPALHLLERHERIGVVVAEAGFARVPLPRFFDDRDAAAFEEVGAPALGGLEGVAEIDDVSSSTPDWFAGFFAPGP